MRRTSFWAVFFVVLAACSAKSSGFGGNDGGASPPSDADLLPDGPSCRFEGDASLQTRACGACAEGSCCDVGNQCLSDPECVAVVDCVAACPLDAGASDPDATDDAGTDCADACRQAHRTAIGNYTAFSSCIESRCGTALCPAF